MALDPQLREFMLQEISVRPVTGIDAYGDPTYGTATTYACRVEEKPSRVLTQWGEEVTTSHTIYVDSTTRIPVSSLVTFPDGRSDTPTRSDVYTDETGEIHHVVLFFGGGGGG